MPRITIDGTEYEVGDDRTILQAIDDLGLLMNEVEIPHYCWHPKLSIDGSCRLCQVEVDDIPIVEAQQRNLDRFGPVKDVPVKQDRFVNEVHRVLQRLYADAGITGRAEVARLAAE